MLTIDPDPPNPILSFLKAITLEDSNTPHVLPIIADTDLDLSDLSLDSIFMYQQDDQPTIEKDDVFILHLHHQSFHLHLLSLTTKLVSPIHQ